jgi:hypothetical protein
VNIHEHDCVVLTADLPADGLEAGDVGTVVHIHRGGEAYEVEFMTLAGNTLAVATGGHSVAALSAHQPTAILSDLGDTDTFWRLIDGPA